MAIIGIDPNDVIRDFTGQIEYTYNKYINTGEDINIEKKPLETFDLIKYFPFDTTEELNKFLYQDAALEIFGHADELETNLIVKLNMFIMDMIDLYGHEVVIISRETTSAIPATLFFLSKTACKCKNIKFVTSHKEQWDGIDILITANPEVLKTKPENKTAIKLNRTYNVDSESDYQINSLFELFEELNFINNIISKK